MVDVSWDKKHLIFSKVCLFFLLFFIDPAHSFILPPCPFESTDRFAFLKPGSDRALSDQTLPPPVNGTLIFGPIIFLREREAPKTEQVSFTISDATGPFLLRLTNGTPEGTSRISSAIIKLNGKEIFRPCQFNQNVAELSRQVSLLSGENLLEVRLKSVTGSFITLELFHLDKQACQVLDFHTFKRSKRKPLAETWKFDLGPQFIGPFTLHVINGDLAGNHRVDSAIIKLNGHLVLKSDDFNERVREVSRTVSLLPTNKLSVELRGAPGDFLTLGIGGYDNTPPAVTVTSPSNEASLSESPIIISGTVDDPSSSVMINGIPAQVACDGSFTVEGLILQEGENIVKAVATDACGNQGEDEISVYLRTIPEGPELILCAEPFRERTPRQVPPDCHGQDFARSIGVISGLTDETAVSVTLNGVPLPDGVKINNQGVISSGMKDRNFFWAFVDIPQVDGNHPFTAVAINAEGGQTEATVTFLRDTVLPQLTVASPTDGLVTSNPEITIAGTVDDPEAMVRMGWYGDEIPVEDGSFTTTYTLRSEESNYVTVTATDPAGNSAYVTRMVILDTQPPQINVAYPAEGYVVNTSTLNVTGNIIDKNINEIAVSVNGSQPQTLTLTGTNFSGAVALIGGPNTLVFHAVDKAGNTASVTHSVMLDVEIPAVAVTSPLSGVVISGMVNVAVEASDSSSGITSVAVFVDGQLQATLNVPPFNFALDSSMLPSGMHTITVRAIDGALNQAETSISVTVDNTAPVVAITSPVSDAFVSGLINVLVQASDELSGMASVSLYADGLLQTTLTEPPFSFSFNTLQFASGSHKITARGIDTAGNQGEASAAIIFDHEVPSVAITAPASGAMVSGIISVSVEASDSISGVASVTLNVDNQPHATLSQSPYGFSVDTSGLAPGPHTLTARATDQVGNQAEASVTIVLGEGIRVEITSPIDGSTFNKSSAIVRGRIYDQMGEIGAVVNGVLAEVEGSDFAVIVPLQPGQNIVVAAVKRPDGLQGQAQIAINTETQEEFVRLTATPTSGILEHNGILNVTFEAEAYSANPISSYSWDFNGDGSPEIVGTDSLVTAQYQYPGLYYPRVTVTDTQGNAYAETTLVHVLSREEMDALLRSKWEGMKAALNQGDINGALNYFIKDSREEYREIFELLAPQLPALVSAMREINMVEIRGNLAEYYIKRFQKGVEISYFIYFMRDENGIWRISSF